MALAHLGEIARAKEMLSIAKLKAAVLDERERIDATLADVEKLLRDAEESNQHPPERGD